jgi:DNA-binding ferritin-like protein
MYAVTGPIAQALGLPQQSSATSEPMTPESSPSPKVGELVQKLIMLAGYLKELETQAHLAHLNFEGENFIEIHRFLKDQYEAHLEQFDAVSEFVRSMDYWMPMCSCGLKDAVCGFKNIEDYDGRHILMTYYGNIEALGYLTKELEQAAARAEAPDVQNYMAELVGFAFKSAWFLKATLRGC